MKTRVSSYYNLDGNDWEQEPVTWYWRLLALLSSWMILGGYLMFPSAYDSDPQLRYSLSLLYVMIATLLAAGYSSTVLLWFSCENITFRTETVFLPSLASSALGLLTLLYQFASSSRYTWNAAATVATVTSSLATITYASLLFWTHRRATPQVLVAPKISSPAPSTYTHQTSHSTDQSWQHYRSYGEPVPDTLAPEQQHRLSAQSVLSEDEQVNQQMAMLLAKRDSGHSPGLDQQTFRIALPENHESRPGTSDGDTLRMFRRQTGASTQSPHSTFSSRGAGFPGLGLWGRVAKGRVQGRAPDKSRNGDAVPMDKVKRREDRRREIEQGRNGEV